MLSGSESSGYTLTLADQTKYKFAGSSGRLESVTDRDGNITTLTYNEGGQLTTITDPVGRTIKLTYNGEGLVESAEDPMKHVVKYTYEGGNLKSVTQPGEALGRAVLGGTIVSPQLLLDLIHALTPEEAEAALAALGCK